MIKQQKEDIKMVLIKCPECGREISDKAVSCPGCGYPISFSNLDTTNDISISENSIDSLVADVVSRNNYKKVFVYNRSISEVMKCPNKN